MVRLTKAPCIIGSFFLLAVISAVFFTVRPQTAHGARDSCPLSATQKVRAVKAFTGLAPIFKEPRCLNCHGAVNPFSRDGGHGGGYIDIQEETKKFLQLPDFSSALTTGSDPTGTITAKTIAGLKEMAESPTEISDNDLIRRKAFDPMRKACKECHIFSWIIPMRHNHFVGRSTKQMCVHIKTSSLTNQPDLFLRHMQDDELVLEGFKGRKGLLETGGAEPPQMSFATLVKYANDWIDAMGGKYHDPPDCGCTAEGIVLEFDSTITATMPSGQGYSLAVSKSTVHATVGLKFMEGRGWVGEGIMNFETVPMNPPAKCLARVYGKGTTTFHVTRGSISKDDEPFAVTLYIKPGETQDISELNCGYMQDKSPMAFWNTNFYFSRMRTHNYNTGDYEIAGWTQMLDSDVFAKKTIRANCSLPARRCQEETTLTLRLMDEPDAGASLPK